jgi:dethiobiotin synthetase
MFITGTDTNVGKTVVAAAVMLRYRGEAALRYWKPVQTGIEQDDDTQEVKRLSRVCDNEVLNRGVRLPGPLSPHLAARRAGTRVTVQSLVDQLHTADLKVSAARNAESRIALDAARGKPNPESRLRWIVEGAGGALVPLNERETMADLMQALDLPVLIATRSTLGTINHTCMTIEVLRRRMLRVAGVVMVGERNDDNRLAIERYGAAEVIGQMPRFDPLTPEALDSWVHAEFDRSGVLFVGALR